MRRQLWTILAMMVLSASLLTLAQRTTAGTTPGCCICTNCPSDGALATCQDIDLIGSPANCPAFCLTSNCINSTANTTNTGTCADVALCQAVQPAGAPALGANGLTAAGLLLAAVGLLQVIRLRKQS